MMTRALVAFVLLVASTTYAGERRPAKVRAAWEWSIEERIAMRFAARAPNGEARMIVDGATHPELLMPWEMFDALFPVDDTRRPEVHARLRADIERLGWNPDAFWSRAEPIARPYLNLLRDMLAADRRRLDRSGGDDEQRELAACALRAATIDRLRRELGPNFDRLLYEAIAPTMTISGGTATPEAAQHAMFVARGCR